MTFRTQYNVQIANRKLLLYKLLLTFEYYYAKKKKTNNNRKTLCYNVCFQHQQSWTENMKCTKISLGPQENIQSLHIYEENCEMLDTVFHLFNGETK